MAPTPNEERQGAPVDKPLSVVGMGAHPDDCEEACFGTLARYAEAGHGVTALYLTRGEGPVTAGKEQRAALAALRTAEAEAACKVIGARAVFVGQRDDGTEVSRKRGEELNEVLSFLAPDIVFTHWPIDTHPDHQVASLLTMRAYFGLERPFRLYFFEVESGTQSRGFVPLVYVDITATRAKKEAALAFHKSQGGVDLYRAYSQRIEQFRGSEVGVEAAEAFFPASRTDKGFLPGLG